REMGDDDRWSARFHGAHDAFAEAFVKDLGARAHDEARVAGVNIVESVVVDDAFSGLERRARRSSRRFAFVPRPSIAISVPGRFDGAFALYQFFRQVRKEAARREVLSAAEQRARGGVGDEEAFARAGHGDVGEASLLVELVFVGFVEAAIRKRL